MTEPPAPATAVQVDEAPTSSERSAACLAIASYVFCSVVGPLIAVWWARTNHSTHARRYAVLSLLLELPILVGLVVVVPFAIADATNTVALLLIALWLFQGVLCAYSLILAIYAWRGRDIADAPVPGALVRRIR